MRVLAALVGMLALTLGATASSRGGASPNVKGTLVRGPVVITCHPNEPCDQPPFASFLVFARNGQSTRVRLGANGRFAVRLTRGLYRVSVLPSRNATVTPATLRVPRAGVIHPRFVQRTSH